MVVVSPKNLVNFCQKSWAVTLSPWRRQDPAIVQQRCDLCRRLSAGYSAGEIAPQMRSSTQNNGGGFLQEFGIFLSKTMGGDLIILEPTEPCNCAARMRLVKELSRRMPVGHFADKMAPQMHYSTKQDNMVVSLKNLARFCPKPWRLKQPRTTPRHPSVQILRNRRFNSCTNRILPAELLLF